MAAWESISQNPEKAKRYKSVRGQGGFVRADWDTATEMIAAANHGWTMAPGLLHGAYECLKHHGSDALKSRYLGRIASGAAISTISGQFVSPSSSFDALDALSELSAVSLVSVVALAVVLVGFL